MTWLKNHDFEVAFVLLLIVVGWFDPALGVVLPLANAVGVMLGYTIASSLRD